MKKAACLFLLLLAPVLMSATWAAYDCTGCESVPGDATKIVWAPGYSFGNCSVVSLNDGACFAETCATAFPCKFVGYYECGNTIPEVFVDSNGNTSVPVLGGTAQGIQDSIEFTAGCGQGNYAEVWFVKQGGQNAAAHIRFEGECNMCTASDG